MKIAAVLTDYGLQILGEKGTTLNHDEVSRLRGARPALTVNHYPGRRIPQRSHTACLASCISLDIETFLFWCLS